MGFYSSRIFPRLMDWTLSKPEIEQIRRSVLAEVRGNIFEIGFGTGLNLPHYPAGVTRITAVDPNPGAAKIAAQRIAASSIRVEFRQSTGEALPFQSSSFDSIVCTFTLCSILDVDRALSEMYRILAASGRFYFAEHGLADDPGLQRWQRVLTPVQMRIADGCHLDRDAAALLRRNGFRIRYLDNFYLNRVPRIAGYIYRGVAEKS